MSKTENPLQEDFDLNIHPYYFQKSRAQRKSLVSYHHHKSVHGHRNDTLESVLGALEGHYTDENSRSLTSQLERISSSFRLYPQDKEERGLAPIGDLMKKSKKKGKVRGGCDCNCNSGSCECECIEKYGSCECNGGNCGCVEGSKEDKEYEGSKEDKECECKGSKEDKEYEGSKENKECECKGSKEDKEYEGSKEDNIYYEPTIKDFIIE